MWESQTTIMTDEKRGNLTWEYGMQKKVELIIRKLFPKAYCMQKKVELMNLTQGNMAVLDYEQRFNQLSRYAPYLVDIDEKKAWRFENGYTPRLEDI